ncbi:MAG TPA: PDZ domain-containing protein [Thermoanaerobaculia bacterium]|jgi:predicted metalloprotease with PDZ domain
MRFRVSTTIVAILLTTAVLQAGEPACSVAASECENEIHQMLTGRRYLGVQIVELKPGLVIKSVVVNSPAARAGLRENDRLIGVNGRSLAQASAREFKELLAKAKETGRLWMIVQRRGAYRKIEVRLEPYTQEQIQKIVAQHLAQAHTTPPTTAGAH